MTDTFEKFLPRLDRRLARLHPFVRIGGTTAQKAVRRCIDRIGQRYRGTINGIKVGLLFFPDWEFLYDRHNHGFMVLPFGNVGWAPDQFELLQDVAINMIRVAKGEDEIYEEILCQRLEEFLRLRGIASQRATKIEVDLKKSVIRIANVEHVASPHQ